MVPALTFVWPETAVTVAVVLAGALLLRVIVGRLIDAGLAASLRTRAGRAEGQGDRAASILGRTMGVNAARHEARSRTIASVLKSAVSVTVTVVALLMVIAAVGGNAILAPLLTSAGIGGVALAFGAQSLVKDYISGILMILEDQYGVGDLIDTGEVVGTVEEVGLRVTRLRDAGGQVWYVRNGEIQRIGNQSQGWSTATIDVPIAYDEDAGRAIAILDTVTDAVYADERWADVLLDRPTVAGVESVRGGTMTLRVFAKCAPNQQWGVQRDILERSVEALRAGGVRGPVLGAPPPPTTG